MFRKIWKRLAGAVFGNIWKRLAGAVFGNFWKSLPGAVPFHQIQKASTHAVAGSSTILEEKLVDFVIVGKGSSFFPPLMEQ